LRQNGDWKGVKPAKESSDESEDNRCSSHYVVYCLFLRAAVVFVYPYAYLNGLILKKLDIFLIYLMFYFTQKNKIIYSLREKNQKYLPFNFFMPYMMSRPIDVSAFQQAIHCEDMTERIKRMGCRCYLIGRPDALFHSIAELNIFTHPALILYEVLSGAV
jgi:hypothetical protein